MKRTPAKTIFSVRFQLTRGSDFSRCSLTIFSFAAANSTFLVKATLTLKVVIFGFWPLYWHSYIHCFTGRINTHRRAFLPLHTNKFKLKGSTITVTIALKVSPESLNIFTLLNKGTLFSMSSPQNMHTSESTVVSPSCRSLNWSCQVLEPTVIVLCC